MTSAPSALAIWMANGAKDITGKIQQEVGKLVGSEEQQAKGLQKQAEGKIQKGIGNVKEAVADLKDAAKK